MTRTKWLTFQFSIEPKVLGDILKAIDPTLVVINRRVPLRYQGTPIAQYLADYSRYVDAIFDSPETVEKASIETIIGLATNVDWESSSVRLDSRYKSMELDGPVVCLSPMALHFDKKTGQLCTYIRSNLYFGLQLTVNHDLTQNSKVQAAQLPALTLFDTFKLHVEKVTSPCLIRSKSRDHRTRIRISDHMRERMRTHPGLRAAHLIQL